MDTLPSRHQQLYENSNNFMISSAVDGSYISPSLKLVENSTASAGTFTISDLGNRQGYAISTGQNGFLGITSIGTVIQGSQKKGYLVSSVTYRS
jgi:hypothetical protein